MNPLIGKTFDYNGVKLLAIAWENKNDMTHCDKCVFSMSISKILGLPFCINRNKNLALTCLHANGHADMIYVDKATFKQIRRDTLWKGK